MNNVINEKICTGCTACVSVCAKKAIKMHTDKNGFKYPIINQKKCIDCKACKKICPVLNSKEKKSLNKCYAAYNVDDDEKKKSSSGAIFPLLANYILANNGIVIGAAFENNILKHIPVTNIKDLDKLKGSKYLQSDMTDILEYIKANVKFKKILFVGTPCQVAGVKSIMRENQNLICVDIICHGVPSPKLFKKYIKELETKNNDSIINYNFRDKCTGWDTYSNTVVFKNKTVTELAKDNKYMKLFLSDIALRNSCYNCNFKLGNKYSDITLGDFWGINNCYKDMYNKKGVSAVIINTEKGNDLFEVIKNNLKYKECKLDEITKGNPSLKYSSKISKKRNKFWDEIDYKSIDVLCKKYSKKTNIIKRIFKKIKTIKN